MTSSFRFLEDIALADSAFEARGSTPSELFAAAGRAVIEAMVDPRTVSAGLTKDQALGVLEVHDVGKPVEQQFLEVPIVPRD